MQKTEVVKMKKFRFSNIYDREFFPAEMLERSLSGMGILQKKPVLVFVPHNSSRAERISKFFERSEKAGMGFVGEIEGQTVAAMPTGVGCAVTATVIERLAYCGVKYLIKMGSAGGLHPDMKVGDICIPTACVRGDGASREYIPESFPAVSDFDVHGALVSSARESEVKPYTGIHLCHDSLYTENRVEFEAWRDAGVISVDMETSIVFVLASLRGIKAGAIFTISENVLSETKEDDSAWISEEKAKLFREKISVEEAIAYNAAKKILIK